MPMCKAKYLWHSHRVKIQCLECGEGLPFTGHEHHGEKEKSGMKKRRNYEKKTTDLPALPISQDGGR